MKKLADIQNEIQQAIMGSCKGAERLVAEPPRGSPAGRLGIYRSAYTLRLTEFLENDYEKLRIYLGEIRFHDMAESYIAAHPSDQPNARWFSRHLPEFLAGAKDYRRQPEISELARLERAINDAFDGPEHPVCSMADVAAIDPAQIGTAVFGIAPTVHRFSATTNVSSLWASLKCGEIPPPPEDAALPTEIMVWRQGAGARFRILGDEEAMAVDSARDGVSFGVICEMIATFDDPDGAAIRAAGYLRGWIEAGIVSSIRCGLVIAK